MTEAVNTKSFEEGWDLYQAGLQIENATPAQVKTVNTLRTLLIRKGLNERGNILADQKYLTLIQHEKEYMLNTERKRLPKSNVVALTEAALYGLGRSEQSKEEILAFYEEQKSKAMYSPPILHIVTENVLYLLMNEENTRARSELVNYLAEDYEIEFLRNATDAEKEEQVIEICKGIDAKINDLEVIKENTVHLLETLLICLSLFILLWSKGDAVNARYYLMKAADLNYDFYLHEFSIRFLKQVVLLSDDF